MSNLSRTVRDELVRYFRHLAARVERAARATPPDQFWVKPLSFGNSVGHLLLHLTGNLNHYIGSLVAGTAYVRDRPLEFTDPAGYPPDEVLGRFKDAIEMVVRTIESQDDADLMTAVKAQDPIETRFGLLLVCAAHLNNHIGQLAYLVQAHGRSTNEPPIW
jgi:uncharacterized damage-inducible protein DinB